MGYGSEPAPEDLSGKPAYVGSARTVLDECYRIHCNVGLGTFIRFDFRHKGKKVSEAEVRHVLDEAEYQRMVRSV
jgi:hypothetical protein